MQDYFIPSVFFTLFFVVDPLGLVPVFLPYLSGYTADRRRRIVVKAVVIALAASLFFIFFGNALLRFLGISAGSFLIAGGILLFLVAIDMLFARPARTKVSEPSAPDTEGDISVFPLAIPMLCGPGNIAALLMFSAQVQDDPAGLGLLVLITVVVFALALIIMFLAVSLQRLLGDTGLSVIQRLMGLILSALAVQFIVNGLKRFEIL